jgi:hypothetical protein
MPMRIALDLPPINLSLDLQRVPLQAFCLVFTASDPALFAMLGLYACTQAEQSHEVVAC